MSKFMISKFKSKCSETGKAINKGEKFLFDSNNKKAYCSESNMYKKTVKKIRFNAKIKAKEKSEFSVYCKRNGI